MIKLRLGKIGAIFVGSLLALYISFISGYPIHYLGDTATYISIPFTKEYGDYIYSNFYAYFLYYFSLDYSLWIPVFAQSFILTYLLFEFHINISLPIQQYNNTTIQQYNNTTVQQFLAVICILVITTSISKVASRILPDVFTASAILANFGLLFFKQHFTKKILFLVLFLFSLLFHSSHILLFAAVNLSFFFVLLLYKVHSRLFLVKSFSQIAGILCLAVLCQVYLNKQTSGEYFFSKSNHVYLMDKLSEFGLLVEFYRQPENESKYSLSKYKDNLTKLGKAQFMWNRELSPMYLEYGDSPQTWQLAKEQYTVIIKDVLSRPSYLLKFAFSAFRGAIAQMFMFHYYENEGSSIGYTYNIQKYYPADYAYYSTSLQYFSIFKMVDTYFYLFTGVFFFLSIPVAVYQLNKGVKNPLSLFLLFVVIVYLANALLVSSVSFIQGRYSDKLAWMFVLVSIYVVLPVLERKWLRKQDSVKLL